MKNAGKGRKDSFPFGNVALFFRGLLLLVPGRFHAFGIFVKLFEPWNVAR